MPETCALVSSDAKTSDVLPAISIEKPVAGAEVLASSDPAESNRSFSCVATLSSDATALSLSTKPPDPVRVSDSAIATDAAVSRPVVVALTLKTSLWIHPDCDATPVSLDGASMLLPPT